jgi:phage-related protein
VFNSYEFTFGGESSAMYGLMLYDIGSKSQSDTSFGNKASIVETRTNNRVQPIHFGVNYNKNPLSFKLVFGSERELDRYELESVAFWLTGHQQYKWLTIEQPDLDHVAFRCLITQLTPISHGWLPVAFEASVTCDCPYAYGYPFQEEYQVDGQLDALFRNDSSVHEYCKPTLTWKANQTGSLSIVNRNDREREFLIAGIPQGSTVTVDCANGIITQKPDGLNLYRNDLQFFRLVNGDNNFTITGNGTLTLSGRLLYNVAG